MGQTELRAFIFANGLIPAHFIANPSVEWIRILSSMFLHGSWLHIISNMWVLFIFGDNVEGRLGNIRYAIFYLLSGAAAALLQIYILSSSTEPMIGASGAIAGVLGAYLVLFPRSRIASLVPVLFIFTIVEIPAFVLLLLWFGLQVYSGLFAAQGGAAGGIAWWAHIGGFLFGAIMVSFFVRRGYTYSRWQ
jgi:rhomboid family protein